MQIKNQIIKILKKESPTPFTVEKITKFIGPTKGININNVQRALDQILDEGKIVCDKQRQYYIHKSDNVIGNFEANKKGFGFVITKDFDVYIKSNNIGNAMNGDLVETTIIKKRKGLSFEGKILNIIKRSSEKVVGRIEEKQGKQFIFPSDRRLNYLFEVERPIKFEEGSIAEAKIVTYPRKGKGRCQITEVIGNEDDANVEIEMIIREHSLRDDFSKKVIKEATEIPQEINKEEAEKRKNYCNDYVVTIDGLDAKDFDDAISISKKKDVYNLNVHIADVSHYIKKNSAINEEAQKRSFSTYLADRVLPMLPESLSNGICSLNPEVERLTVSVEMAIDNNCNILSYSIDRGVIRSKARLTYSEVDEAFMSNQFKDEKQKETLLLMRELSDLLEERREKQGSINFETIEPKVIFDKEQNPVSIDIKEKTPATKLIEEAMVITNEAVARFIQKNKIAFISRIHEEPAEDALEEIRLILGQMGYPAKKIGKATAENFQQILKFARKRKDKLIINNLLLRLMQKARYSTLTTGHFGLALKYYAHFTSPIRRYPDLLVHRQVKSILDKKEPLSEEYLADCSQIATVQEKESEEAERESNMFYIAKLMKDEVGSVYKGVVSGVTNFGLFIMLPNSAEGLVHISNIKGDYYRFEEKKHLLRGVRTGQVFRLGQAVKVKLIDVIVGERRIDLMLV